MSARLGVIVALLCTATPLAAQRSERLLTGAVFERYTFGAPFVVNSISEWSVPVSVEIGIGEGTTLALSTGYVGVEIESRDSAQVRPTGVYAPLDTEARLSVPVVADRVVALLMGTIPTGRQTLASDEFALLATLANDAIGFSTPSFGAGGSVGAGVSGAIPLGRFAIGTAATATYPFAFQPVIGDSAELKPGFEVRVRGGVEGPLASRTYLRTAMSVAVRQKDEIGSETAHGVGHRLIGYAALEQGLGSVTLGLHVFDVYRGSPQIESTSIGTGVLPRGNLLGVGARVSVPLGRRFALAPHVEYRVATAASSLEDETLVRQAVALRAGSELRLRAWSRVGITLKGEFLSGETYQSGLAADISGFLAAIHVEVTP